MSRAFEVDWTGTGEEGPLFRTGPEFGVTEAAELRVPLKVDVGVGSNWDEAH